MLRTKPEPTRRGITALVCGSDLVNDTLRLVVTEGWTKCQVEQE